MEKLGRIEKSQKKVKMAQEQKCCVSDMGHLIPQIKSTTTSKISSLRLSLVSNLKSPLSFQIITKLILKINPLIHLNFQKIISESSHS